MVGTAMRIMCQEFGSWAKIRLYLDRCWPKSFWPNGLVQSSMTYGHDPRNCQATSLSIASQKRQLIRRTVEVSGRWKWAKSDGEMLEWQADCYATRDLYSANSRSLLSFNKPLLPFQPRRRYHPTFSRIMNILQMKADRKINFSEIQVMRIWNVSELNFPK